MEEKKTLKETLDEMGAGPGDDRGFIVQVGLFSRTVMNVSRRYLECESWKHLLDYKVLGYFTEASPFGGETTKFIIQKD